MHQNLGEPIQKETRQFDSQGRELIGNGSSNATRRIEEAKDDEKETEADRQYRERMEDEYAKREGGA